MVIMRAKPDLINDKMDVVYRHVLVWWFGEAFKAKTPSLVLMM